MFETNTWGVMKLYNFCGWSVLFYDFLLTCKDPMTVTMFTITIDNKYVGSSDS